MNTIKTALKNIRIVQLIDSLEAGGAERMAVTYANALAKQIAFSGLVATRKEGLLKDQVGNDVAYTFLNKQGQLDYKALWRLRQFCKQNRVDYIHAHSSSFFWAVLIKISLPSIKVIWHDHYGNSEFLAQRSSRVLGWCSYLFSVIIVVNEQLKQWSQQNLHCASVVYLPNFVEEPNGDLEETTFLKGEDGKRIVLLANLRPQKDHPFLLEIAQKLKVSHPAWTFHLIGKDFEDEYSENLKKQIVELGLSNNVWIYGSRTDVSFILKQATIGILTSQSEGLPVALLEYGMNQLPIVVTSVGEIPSVIENGRNGYVVKSGDVEEFVEKLQILIENSEERHILADNLHQHIVKNYTSSAVFETYFSVLNEN